MAGVTAAPGLVAARPRSAGGVVWRRGREGVELLLVRERSGAWSLPKGRLEPQESTLDAALREVREETGLRCHPAGLVGSVVYPSRTGVTRAATYWLMRPVAGRLEPGPEIDVVRWASVELALRLLAGRPEFAILELVDLGALAGRSAG